MSYVLEPCPPNPSMVTRGGHGIPNYGGKLFYNPDTGLAGCPECGWSGVPTIVSGDVPVIRRDVRRPARGDRPGVASTRCPHCEIRPRTEFEVKEDRFWSLGQVHQRRTVKVPRNQPCPCGSGVKAKKCACAEYAA